MGESRGAPPVATEGKGADGEPYRDIDRAAILGATLAAILALTLPPGPWGWLALFTGIALSAIVLFYFRIPRGGGDEDAASGRRVLSTLRGQLVAHAAVVALCLGLAVAWPWQELLQHYWRPAIDECRERADMAAREAGISFDAQLPASTAGLREGEMRDPNPAEVRNWVVSSARRSAADDCKGDAATDRLWLPMSVFFVLTFLVDNGNGLRGTWNRIRVRRRPIRRFPIRQFLIRRFPIRRRGRASAGDGPGPGAPG